MTPLSLAYRSGVTLTWTILGLLEFVQRKFTKGVWLDPQSMVIHELNRLGRDTDRDGVKLTSEVVGTGEIVEVDTGERFWVDEGALYAVNEKARALSLDLPTVDEDRLKELTETLNDECCLIGWMEVEPRSERVPWWKGFWSFLHDPNIWESPPCEEGQENMIANYILRNDWEAWHDLFAYVENGTAYHTPTGAIIWYKDGQGHAVNEQAAMEFPELPEAPTTLDRKKVETRLLEEFRDCVESAATVPWPNDYLEGSKENFDLCFKDNPDAIRAIYGNACCDVERCE